jgi:hypothetical protein
MDVCIIDIAAEFIKFGIVRFKLRSTTFEIRSTINDHANGTVKYIMDMKSNVESLKESGNLV